MGSQHGRGHKPFPAALAHVGVLLRVHRNHVLLHITRLAGSVPAQVARVRPVPQVGASVPDHVAFLRKTRAALGALVRPFSRVDGPMPGQVTLVGESHAAGGADEGPLPRVASFVPGHVVLLVAGVRAAAAPVPAPRPQVRLHPATPREVPGGEEAVAFCAREGLRRRCE